MQYLGIDGCKIGWFFVALNDRDEWESGTVAKIAELSHKIQKSRLTLIDIPIGFRENNPRERLCDISARKILGQRHSSVFPAPSRLAIQPKMGSVLALRAKMGSVLNGTELSAEAL